MTRINCIPVEELADQHLMAEYRELPMVNASLAKTIRSKSQNGLKTIPDKYTLNTGHVRFFYDKGLFLYNRYNRLIDELRARQFDINPAERTVDWTQFIEYNGGKLYNDWTPSEEDCAINVERLVLRLRDKIQWYRHHKVPLTEQFVYKLEERYNAIPIN